MLGALAHHVFDGLRSDGRQRKVGQHAVEGLGEVAQGVDHGAVEIDDGGVHVAVDQGNLHG